MNPILLIILTILLPPLGVYLKSGTGNPLIINIILCFFFWFPAIIHGLYVVTRK